VNRRRVATAVGVAVAVSAVWWGPLALRPFGFFAVRRIELVGVRYQEPVAVIAALGLRSGASVWDRLGVLAERLTSLQGVTAAAVSTRLPGTLRVRIEEEEPIALALGQSGLVPVGAEGRPLPYDPARVPVDVPVVDRPARTLVGALAVVRTADPAFFGSVGSARRGPAGSLELELDGGGLVRLALPVDPAVVVSVASVARDLAARSQRWRELDGRYAGWVVVRKAQGEGSS
jgi:cell division septal protein FtsQ